MRLKEIGVARASEAIEDLGALPLIRHGHVGLLDRILALRDNMTAHDAAYVALAEALEASLVTCDAVLAASPGCRARIEVVA